MLSLIKSEKFQKEYNDFKEQIDNIKNESVKKELTGLLNQLVVEVRAIDQQHEDLAMSMRLSNNIVDRKSNLLDIRKKISSLLSNV